MEGSAYDILQSTDNFQSGNAFGAGWLYNTSCDENDFEAVIEKYLSVMTSVYESNTMTSWIILLDQDANFLLEFQLFTDLSGRQVALTSPEMGVLTECFSGIYDMSLPLLYYDFTYGEGANIPIEI
jgi:hypothetical protein